MRLQFFVLFRNYIFLEIAAVEANNFAGKTNGGKKKIPESQLNKLGKLCKQSSDAVLKRFVNQILLMTHITIMVQQRAYWMQKTWCMEKPSWSSFERYWYHEKCLQEPSSCWCNGWWILIESWRFINDIAWRLL